MIRPVAYYAKRIIIIITVNIIIFPTTNAAINASKIIKHYYRHYIRDVSGVGPTGMTKLNDMKYLNKRSMMQVHQI